MQCLKIYLQIDLFDRFTCQIDPFVSQFFVNEKAVPGLSLTGGIVGVPEQDTLSFAVC